MGLLDNFSEFIKTPEGMGLLSAVAGGLAGAGRGTPINNIGRAGLAGMMGYGNALDRQERTAENAVQNQIRNMQIEELKRKQEAIARLAQNVPQDMQPFVGVAPEAVLKNMFKEPDYKVVGNEVVQFGPEGVKPVYTAPADPNKMSRRDELEFMSQLRKDEREFAAKLASSNQSQQMRTPVVYENDKGEFVYGDLNDARGRRAGNFSPQIQGAIAGAKEAAKTEAEERTKATLDAPRVIDNATTALKYSDELLGHPGFGIAVGKSAMLGTQKIPGTPGYDFINRLDQLKGGAFLEAFNTLKGGGQITEVEGKKATDAIARMDNATSESEFRAAVKDYQDVIRKGMNRAKMKVKPVAPVQQLQQGGAKFLGFE